ncbi:MAG: hypothetical protein H8E44_29275 [Planctomycetes bacterium]|nr:hypothetical protein [Planctomycetota bacterium]MBL7042735.1 hypothetical protein [Pirellulaceae bacterium]
MRPEDKQQLVQQAFAVKQMLQDAILDDWFGPDQLKWVRIELLRTVQMIDQKRSEIRRKQAKVGTT